LPTDDADLETVYSEQDITDVATKDDTRVDQSATGDYAIHQFKDYVGDEASANLEWEGQSTVAPSESTVYLQIYNYDTLGWETVQSNNATGADTDFTLSGNIADLTNYKDGDIITCRVYQESV